MKNIADLLRVMDVLISQSGATEIRINPAAGNMTVDVEFFFLPLKNRRTGQVIRGAQYITTVLDLEQEIDHRNPYYKRIAEEVRYVITASTAPAPGADHLPPQPAP